MRSAPGLTLFMVLATLAYLGLAIVAGAALLPSSPIPP